MGKRKVWQRLLAVALALSMICSTQTMSAFADIVGYSIQNHVPSETPGETDPAGGDDTTATLTPTETKEINRQGIITADTVNLREQPTTESASLATLAKDTAVTAVNLLTIPEDDLKWYEVQTEDGTKGYVREDLMALAETETETEVETETETETESESETEALMPAQEFTQTAGSTVVTVSAPEGAFPEGATMEAVPVSAETVIAAVEDQVAAEGKEIVDVVAVDITFYDKDGNEIQPAVNVEVSFENVPVSEEAEEAAIYHIDEASNAEVVAEVAPEDAEATFQAESFSVYAIVKTQSQENQITTFGMTSPDDEEIATYTFVVDGKTKNTQKVKPGDKLYEPETPQKDGYKFVGWYSDVDDEDTKFTNFDVPLTEAETTTLTAKFEEVYYVFFMDGTTDDSRVIATKEGTEGDVIDTSDVTFPVGPDQAITGWMNGNDLVGTEITLEKENITLTPVVQEGAWITFESAGGSYISPVFVAPNSETSAPTEPSRPGYEFAGWYQGETEFEFGGTLSDSITLTAHWTAVRVQYTVIHWWENANDEGYTYHESETFYGITGNPTDARAKTYRVSGKNLLGDTVTDNDVFTAGTIEQQTIAGDGSTIVNVYYNRKTYTLTFYDRNYNGGANYNSKLHTITKKWGADIAKSEWPNSFESYRSSNSNWQIVKASGWGTLNKYLAYISTMPMNGGTLWRPDTDDDELSATYYVEALVQDRTGGGTYNSVAKLWFVEHHVDEILGSSGFSVGDEDRYPITGFTLITGRPSTSTGSDYDGAEFYYRRNSYDIIYINVNSEETVSYRYQADISKAGEVVPEKPSTVPAGYVFTGWYADPEGSTPYNFTGSTMPAENITVYAGWGPDEFEGKAYGSIDGGEIIWNKTINYGEIIDESVLPDPDKIVPEGYEWHGWCIRTGEEGNYTYTPFNFSQEIYSDIELYPYYTSASSFSVKYEGNGGEILTTDSKKYAEDSYADIQQFVGTAPEGKVFLYWNTEKDGSGTSYYPNQSMRMPAENVTLYAIYGSNTTTITYHSNFTTEDVTEKQHIRRTWSEMRPTRSWAMKTLTASPSVPVMRSRAGRQVRTERLFMRRMMKSSSVLLMN